MVRPRKSLRLHITLRQLGTPLARIYPAHPEIPTPPPLTRPTLPRAKRKNAKLMDRRGEAGGRLPLCSPASFHITAKKRNNTCRGRACPCPYYHRPYNSRCRPTNLAPQSAGGNANRRGDRHRSPDQSPAPNAFMISRFSRFLRLFLSIRPLRPPRLHRRKKIP
jgi:hypothetical protein